MARISTYGVSTPAELTDELLGSDANKDTKNFTVGSILDLTGIPVGTDYTLAMFGPGTTLVDSIVFQDASGTRIGIGGNPQRELDVFGGIRVRGPLDLFQQNDNTLVGQDAGNWYNILGFGNTAFGKDSQKVQVGGSRNTSVGYASMSESTLGNLNVAVGVNTLRNNDGGSYNTAVGASALQDQEAGQGNTAIGYNSLNNKDESNFNTALGHISLFNISTGFKNIGIGDNVGSTLTSGNRNVLIGSNANVLAYSNNNSIVIGESAVGSGSNTVTLGNNNIINTYLKGNVILPATLTVGGTIVSSANMNFVIGSTPVFEAAASEVTFKKKAVFEDEIRVQDETGVVGKLFANPGAFNIAAQGATQSIRLKIEGENTLSVLQDKTVNIASIGIDDNKPLLTVNGAVKIGNSFQMATGATADNAGTLRYVEGPNKSVVEMSMKIGPSPTAYGWVVIKQNNY